MSLRKLGQVHGHSPGCIRVYDHLRVMREERRWGGETIFAAVTVAFVVLFDHGWDIRGADNAFNFVALSLLLVAEVDLAGVPVDAHLGDGGQLGPTDDTNVKISRLVPFPSNFLFVLIYSHKIVLMKKRCQKAFILICS